MKLYIHNKKSEHLPYEEIREAFKAFLFTQDEYIGIGNCLRQTVEKYAVVHIRMLKESGTFVWDVPESKIPIEYMDAILSTIKNIINIPMGMAPFSSYNFSYQIIDGSWSPTDSSTKTFEIATFMAIADIIGFDHEKIQVYKRNKS
ncbi:hypothetical protein [Flavobacterium sp. CAU 1735]|uniref:hypothetical protein n=1 Tax=Flavobacterium sp. CAU 1735 TaxID=3140361 RepID=UPI003260B9CE